MKKIDMGLIAALTGMFLLVSGLLLGITGWVMNLVALFHAPALTLWGGMEVLRLIGVLVAPLGCLLGWM